MDEAALFDELRRMKALIVHCSRLGKGDNIGGLFFPEDLKTAIKLAPTDAELPCSVVWPTHLETWGPIGVVLRPRSTNSIVSVCNADSGSIPDLGTGMRSSLGSPLSDEAVQRTFLDASGYNEWNLKNTDVIGMFVNPIENLEIAKLTKLSMHPDYDPSMMDEVIVVPYPITLSELAAYFPNVPIFSFRGNAIVVHEVANGKTHHREIDPEELYPKSIG